MSEPDEPDEIGPDEISADEIGRELDAIFAEFFGPPTEMDLRGVDPATFALGLSYGFDSWQQARVVANNRRHVATAAQHWAEHHPSPEFLSHTVGTDESAVRHRELLDRAHPGCRTCAEQLQRLAALDLGRPDLDRPDLDRLDPGAPPDDIDLDWPDLDRPDLDRLDPGAPPDDIDLDWLLFQPMEVVRRVDTGTQTARPLHIRGRAQDQSITAEPYGGRDWRITVRDPAARRATVWIGWTTRQITQHEATFENDLAEIDAEAPEERARPQRVRVRIADSP